MQPGRVFTEKRVTGTFRTMGTRPCRRIAAEPLGQAGRAHCSPWVRVLSVWPNTSTEHCWPTLFLKEHRSRVYDVQVKICHCEGLLRNCWENERSQFTYFLQNCCQKQSYYCTIVLIILSRSLWRCQLPFSWVVGDLNPKLHQTGWAGV